jgi:hypothetical protein
LESRSHRFSPSGGLFFRAARDFFTFNLFEVNSLRDDEVRKGVLWVILLKRRDSTCLKGWQIKRTGCRVNPGEVRIKTNGLIRKARTLGTVPSAQGHKSQGLGIVILLGLVQEIFEHSIVLLSEGRSNVENVMPLGEGDAEGLTEDGGEKQEERGSGADGDDS